MFKSRLLSSAVYYAPDDEKGNEKSEKEKVREGIKTTNNAEKEDGKTEDNVDKEDDKEGEEKGEDDDKEGDEGSKDDDEEKEGDEENKELIAEQKEIAKLNKTIERLQKRVGKTTGEKAEIAKQLTAAKTQLEAKVEAGEGLTEEEVERRSDIKAEQKVVQREYDRAVAKLIKEASAIDKEFNTKAGEMAAEVAPVTPFMIGALEDIDNGGAVLAYLADNVDEYEEIFALSPAKIVSRFNRISEKLIEEAKPIKKISKVPEPPEKGLKGNQSSPSVLSDKMPMDDWVRLRQQQRDERRKARLR